MKYVCVCMFVSACVCFSFSVKGERGYSTGRPENGELLKWGTRHTPRQAIYTANRAHIQNK